MKNTRYNKSNKKFTIKKDLPKVVILSDALLGSLQAKVDNHNAQLSAVLYKKCKILTLRKNYRSALVKRVWIPKLGSSDFRPLGIPTIRDRVLQKIIYLALLPIAE